MGRKQNKWLNSELGVKNFDTVIELRILRRCVSQGPFILETIRGVFAHIMDIHRVISEINIESEGTTSYPWWSFHHYSKSYVVDGWCGWKRVQRD